MTHHYIVFISTECSLNFLNTKDLIIILTERLCAVFIHGEYLSGGRRTVTGRLGAETQVEGSETTCSLSVIEPHSEVDGDGIPNDKEETGRNK